MRLALILTASLLAQATAADLPGTVTRAITVGGVARSYELHIPAGLGAAAAPLVLAMHPLFTNGSAMEAITGFTPIAEREHFIVAYPNGLDADWDFGQDGYAHDDVGFLAAVVAAVGAEHAVDRARVFATGMSAGGFMSNVLASERPDLVAAIAPVVGGVLGQVAAKLPPSVPVSVLMMNGTTDAYQPWAAFYGKLLSSSDAAFAWAAADGCSWLPRDSWLPDTAAWDGCKVHVRAYGGGLAGTQVVLYDIQGGGHTWPGQILTAPFGTVCYDFSASEAIWSFFKAHPRLASAAPAAHG